MGKALGSSAPMRTLVSKWPLPSLAVLTSVSLEFQGGGRGWLVIYWILQHWLQGLGNGSYILQAPALAKLACPDGWPVASPLVILPDPHC